MNTTRKWQLLVKDLLMDVEKDRFFASKEEADKTRHDILYSLENGLRVAFEGHIFSSGDTFVWVYEVVDFGSVQHPKASAGET